MRRIVLLGFVLLLPGCESWGGGISDYFGSPFVGVGGFLGDTVTFRRNPNMPLGDSDNMNRVRGREVTGEPLLPEAGNVWPGPPRPQATLSDLERQQNAQPVPQQSQSPVQTPVVPHPQPRGSGTPPESVQPGSMPLSSMHPSPSSPMISGPPPLTGIVQTPQGPAVITNGGNGVQTYTLPNGGTGRAINNANGTVTLIGPDGSVQSVPAPR